MKDKFLIGELAKLFKISTDTLRYYDKMDILKPEYDKNNEYRYYTVRNFFKLSRILFFKSLDISLSEINQYMKNKNRNNLLILLKKKNDEVDLKMNRLLNLKHKIEAKLEVLESIDKEIDQVKIKKIPKRIGTFLDMIDANNDVEIKQAFKKNEKYLQISSWLIEGQIYTSLSKENIANGIFNKFRYFIEIISTDDELCKQIEYIPEHEYACVVFIGPYRDMEKYYQMLTKWINDNGYMITGDSIEKNIVDYDFSDLEDEYVSEIQIPVIKKT